MVVRAAAAPPAGNNFLSRLFGGFAKRAEEPPSRISVARNELLDELTSASPDTQFVEELVQELAASGLPFKEDLLGGGPWVVRYTKGQPLLWNMAYSAVKVANGGNRASQEFAPRGGRTAVNKIEFNGSDTYVVASGTYEPVDDAVTTPKRIKSTITRASLHAFGRDFSLPISGTGSFDVMYADPDVRVFRATTNSLAVQVRGDFLAERLEQ